MTTVPPIKTGTIVTVTELLQPLSHRDVPTTEDLLSKIPESIEDNDHDGFDPVSFDQQLIKDGIAPQLDHVTDEKPVESIPAKGSIEEGTWGGTQLALKEFYNRVETR
jgi:hypothetical protein